MKHNTANASWLIGLVAALLLAGCQTRPSLKLSATSYDAMAGWQLDDPSAALAAFTASCVAPGGKPSAIDEQVDATAWMQACEAAKLQTASQPDADAARRFFEAYFEPHTMSFGSETEGLLTGYYSPEIEGSLTKDDTHPVPVYGLPADIEKGVPYFTRKEIESGALAGRGLEIAWAADVVDVFFLQIQGSGYMKLANGRHVLLQYAGKNNHAYTAIGKVLKDRGEIAEDAVTMQTIREWLKNHLEQRDELLNQNESYVFFSLVTEPQMPRGSQGVPLTPERSLAVDPAYLPYGLPVFLQTQVTKQDGSQAPLNRLMVAQDSGGAIKGAMRGDIFFGVGDWAGWLAGHQKFSGSWTVLLPKAQETGHATQMAAR